MNVKARLVDANEMMFDVKLVLWGSGVISVD